MQEKDKIKIIKGNVDFYYINIVTLLSLRPNLIPVYGKKLNNAVSYHLKGIDLSKIGVIGLIQKQNELRALNSSIILNCFSLFESSFESLLIKELNTKDLYGVQEKVMLRYIDNILKISSENNYNKEYKFITGKQLKHLFSDEEYELYKAIIIFYTLRHKLIHGSASKNVLIDGHMKLDRDDTEYQSLVKFILQQLKLDLQPDLLSLDIMLLDNRITNILVRAIFLVSDKLFKNSGIQISFMKGVPK